MIHHGELLRAETKDHHLVYHLQRHWPGADLDEPDRAMLEFVEKLNSTPGRIVAADVDALRAAGFDDRAVLDVVLITALFNFMNRLADGLGVRADEAFRAAKARYERQVEAELRPTAPGGAVS